VEEPDEHESVPANSPRSSQRQEEEPKTDTVLSSEPVPVSGRAAGMGPNSVVRVWEVPSEKAGMVGGGETL
jgi:hypothetical protein